MIKRKEEKDSYTEIVNTIQHNSSKAYIAYTAVNSSRFEFFLNTEKNRNREKEREQTIEKEKEKETLKKRQ